MWSVRMVVFFFRTVIQSVKYMSVGAKILEFNDVEIVIQDIYQQ